MAGDGATRLADFGLAHFISEDTLSLGIRGTLGYIAPELFYGRSYDTRADIWSFGVTLFELLTGERLFPQTGNLQNLMSDLNSKPIPPVSRYVPDAPELADATLKAALGLRPILEREPGLVGNIASDPNCLDDEQYIVRLIGQVITVSLETVKIVKGLPFLAS